MKQRIIVLLLLCIALSYIGLGCTEKSTATISVKDVDTKKILKVGVFQPLTGAASSGGQDTLEGIELANQMFPEVLNREIQLVIVDNQSDRFQVEKVIMDLIEKEKVKAIIGSYGSSLSMAAGELVQNGKIPTIGCSPTHPLVTQNNDYYFRACFIDPFQGNIMAQYAVDELRAKKAAIIQDITQNYSVSLSNYFMESFQEILNDEKSIVAVTSYHSGSEDFTKQLENIKNSKAEVIFAPGNYRESALLIKQARRMGINIPILGGDTWESAEFLEIGGEEINGAIFSTHFTVEAPITQMSNRFIEAYRGKYKKDPNAFAALGFDAYLLLLEGIKNSGIPDSEHIRDGISQVTNLEGATGYITLDVNGDAAKGGVIKKVNQGKFEYVTVVQPEK